MFFLTIVLATFASEDLTCLAVGLLMARGAVGPFTGLAACYTGILVGDLGLWLIGRFAAGTVLRWRPLARRLPRHRLDSLGRRYRKHGWKAILFSRFLPGARVPMYVGAGMIDGSPLRFALWSAAACAIWTPVLVGSVAWGGEPIVARLERWLGNGWLGVAAAALLLAAVVRTATRVVTLEGRARLQAAVSRLWRWEFWPAWLFYVPLLPWIAYLALRHRGVMTITAANPGIPHGGIVGESKYDILRRLPPEWVVPTQRLDPGPLEQRLADVRQFVDVPGRGFPVILKPDVGERGAGLRLAKCWNEAAMYLAEVPDALLVQAYHPGPFEAGVFYYRFPEETHGRIFSITEKQFPTLTGDGRTTVEALIWRHPRYRMQAAKFLARLNGRSQQVLAAGDTMRLAIAGNHCQGTMFRDGGRWITPRIERRLDEIARAFDGFFFGRFDIRFAELNEFLAGRNFAIVELNGASSESTNLYDPAHSLWSAYAILYRQWRLLFQIGAANLALGRRTSSARELVAALSAHYRHRTVSSLAE
ncbi:MAG: DedA family protein [Planctomycetes bacterium]|nr:DedA family protein [Planctomycetota bacterium]